MSPEPTNPLETDDGLYPIRPKTTASPGGPPPVGAEAANSDAAASVDRLDLEVEIGGEHQLERSFLPGEVLVGRRPSNDIMIDGDGLKVVSGHHMRFAFEGGRWCVEDKGSTNGTFLNGVRVAGLQALSNGDVVELGRPRKVGSYRSVKLCVSLSSRPEMDVTGTSDALEATLVPDEAAAPPTSPSAPSAMPVTDDVTYVSEGFAERIAEGAAESQAPNVESEPIDLSQTIASIPRVPVADAEPQPTLVPASNPENLRALIEKVQEKSRRLGEVSYRLDAHVADLASAVVERHGALGLAEVEGGAEVVDRINEREQRSEDQRKLEAELPVAEDRLADELAPLDADEQARKEEAEALTIRLEEASVRRTETAGTFDELLGGLTTSLRASLGPVVDSIVRDGLPEPAAGSASEPVWHHWTAALARGAEEIKEREEDLDAARALADEAAAEFASVEAESTAATKAWDDARSRSKECRSAGEQSLAEMNAKLAEARTRLASLDGELASAAKGFVLGLLSGTEEPPTSLAALAGMEEAQSFAREAESLRSELADLERNGA